MSRVFKRPMFRKGGSVSAEGILTGLDTPTIDASRTNYEDGGISERAKDFGKRFETVRDVYQKYAPDQRTPMGPGTLSGFLTSFGLDLLSRPAADSIFQTAAQAAQKPFQTFQQAKAVEEAEERALNRAILGDVIEAETEEEQARLEGKAGKGFEFLAKQETLKTLNEQERQLKKSLRDPKLSDAEKESIKQDLADNKELQTLITKEQDPIEQAILAGIKSGDLTLEDYLKYRKTGIIPGEENTQSPAATAPGSKAGGIIGYQDGGKVRVEKPNMNRTSAPVIAMDYQTLRARLPKQVGDDIVKLLTNSSEALTDFANIRTQEDVDQFNDLYKVNLVLPQEV